MKNITTIFCTTKKFCYFYVMIHTKTQTTMILQEKEIEINCGALTIEAIAWYGYTGKLQRVTAAIHIGGHHIKRGSYIDHTIYEYGKFTSFWVGFVNLLDGVYIQKINREIKKIMQ